MQAEMYSVGTVAVAQEVCFTFAEIDPLCELEGGLVVLDHGRDPAVRVQHATHLGQWVNTREVISQSVRQSVSQ